MRLIERGVRALVVVGLAALAYYFALNFGSGGLWRGLGAAHAVTSSTKSNYDLTQLRAVNETLKKIRNKYIDPTRVKPRMMFINALNQVQKEVAQVIILHEDSSPTIKVRVDTEEKEFRVDNVQGPWDVSARLREVFAFLQQHLKDTDVDLRDVEYAACNGMLRTLDPHSVFLSPEAYKEMNLSTSGHFGGLGIVISIRDQMLTIMRPMPETPAGRAGLKRLDRITKINNESTMNMPLDDAVRRLRGKPGSKVTIWIHRDGSDGWTGSRPFELVREEIRIRSVDHRALKPGVGYVRIKQFQASTADELDRALGQFRRKDGIKGLVLDLRGNPGGLLDQAAKVADRFLDRGVIVSTVGHSEDRDEKRATRVGTEPRYPIVVLVNGSSASASEIVSGALKNHDRAVVVGQTTFGKGTVQLVFSRIAGSAALKLTIAQYLTPGDISIQGVGVTPDIELDPMTADTLEMDLYRSENPLKERDLSKSLSYGGVRNTDRPWVTLRYNLPESERKLMRELGGDLEDEFRLDFPIQFARDLVAKLPPHLPRKGQLTAAKSFIDQVQHAEITDITEDLAKLEIDWSAPPAGTKQGPSAKDLVVKASTDSPDNSVRAGEPMTLKVTVTNNGSEPIYQLRGVTKSDSYYYDEKELIFGKLDPGESREAATPLGVCKTKGRKPGSTKPLPLDAPRECQIPFDSVTRQDVVKVRFHAAVGDPPAEAEVRPTVRSLPQPTFAYTYQVVDNRPGNGDGQVARGEGVTIYLDVKNTGDGSSLETQALLSNLSGDGVLLRAGRFDISNIQPGATRQVAFTFDVLDSLKDNLVKVELSVVDRDLRVLSNEKLSIPITRGGLAVKAANQRIEVKERAALRGQPLAAARVIGSLLPGSRLEKVGEFGGFVKVKLDQDRFGFIENEGLAATRAGERIRFEPLLSRSPPALAVKPAALSTRDEKIRIEGVATDGDQVLDTYIFVGSRKVFYQSNRKGTDPTKMSFAHDVALRPGINVITVVTRENQDTATTEAIVVRRDGPGGEALPTPDDDAFGADWEFSPR